mmetsp:Transcript_45678/g.115165  ORF Transcript_45678/g.115165 Transcript_45678/m.115165 type:complete len:258 (+) Transcript_45678:245-1018(+)
MGHEQGHTVQVPFQGRHQSDAGGRGRLDRRRPVDREDRARGRPVRRHRAGAGAPRVPPGAPRPPLHTGVREPRILRHGVVELHRAGREGRYLGGVLARLDGLRQHGGAGDPTRAVLRGRGEHRLVWPEYGSDRGLRGAEAHPSRHPDAQLARRPRRGGLPRAARLRGDVQALQAERLVRDAGRSRRHRRAQEPCGRRHRYDVVVFLQAAGRGGSAVSDCCPVARGRSTCCAGSDSGLGEICPRRQVRPRRARRSRGA